jgi:hypothetical protein
MIKNSLLAFIIATALCIFAIPARAETLITTKPDVNINVNIGEGILEVFGYTSPKTKVILEGQGIYEETKSDKNGYFVFKNTRIRIGKQEICLRALADNSASSQPVCLSIPAKKYIKVGPIILPPVISMNQLQYNVKDLAIIQGSTVPNSDVIVKFFSTDIGVNTTTGISLPEINTRSDKYGGFSVQIPSNVDQRLRFYAQTRFNDADSGKSTTLTVDIMPWWLLIIKLLSNLLAIFRDKWPYVIIAIELLVLALLWLVRRKTHSELMIIEDSPLVLEKHPIIQSTPSAPH